MPAKAGGEGGGCLGIRVVAERELSLSITSALVSPIYLQSLRTPGTSTYSEYQVCPHCVEARGARWLKTCSRPRRRKDHGPAVTSRWVFVRSANAAMTDAPPERPEKPAGGLSLRTAGLITKAPSRAPIEPKLQTLTVRMVEVNRIADIDIITQRFRAEVVLQLAFEGGAKDEDLNNPYAGFPLDSWNRPTFRPSAAWYMAQVDFNNAIEYKTLDAKIVPDGDDLLMNLRFEGVFSEISTCSHHRPCLWPLHSCSCLSTCTCACMMCACAGSGARGFPFRRPRPDHVFGLQHPD